MIGQVLRVRVNQDRQTLRTAWNGEGSTYQNFHRVGPWPAHLVVDDDAQEARILATVLELNGNGHVVAVASEGVQAVQLARHFKPDVVFLDIDMPGRNGCEAAQALHQPKPAPLDAVDALLSKLACSPK